MCGINGVYHFNSNELVNRTSLLRMRDVLQHRGPDDANYYFNGNIGLGHRRLSIIDLANGKQPMCNEDGTVWITFNGEIFNHDDLRRDLVDKGHQFKTQCDTETIIHLYEEEGLDCVKKLRGQFAFAIWDNRKKWLMLARDRVGILPLSYAINANRLIFASELKAILEDKSISRELDLHALGDYLTYRYIPAPRTIFKDIKKLPPAHVLVCKKGNVSIHRYWTLKYQPDEQADEGEYIERVRDKLKESVRIRMMSDVPLGAFLSGGVDSSGIVAFMSQLIDRPKTFSIGFGEQDFDELKYARLIAEHFDTDHYEFQVTPDAKTLLPVLVKQFDEPFADPSAIPTYYVSQMARRHVTVSLSGDGGDETFGGYQRYAMALRGEKFNRIPTGIRTSLFHTINQLIPNGARGKTFTQQLSFASPIDAYGLIQGYLSLSIRNKLLSNEVVAVLNGEHPYELLNNLYNEVGPVDHLAQLQYIDTMSYLPGQILVKVDRTSMLNSLETRPPLLDYQLMELMATTPQRFRIQGGEKKYIFKQVLKDMLPPEILYRSKQGFGVPLKYWFEKDWKDYITDILLDPQAVSRRYLNQTQIKTMLERHSSKRQDFSPALYRLLIFEEWCRCYLAEN